MGVNSGVRKANYERGMKFGDKVYSGQNLRDLIGMTIVEVDSDDLDSNVVMWLEHEERQVAVYFDDICFDGEHMSTVEHSDSNNTTLLRAVTEDDLKEFAGMTRYYDVDVLGEKDKKIGVSHAYCNDIALEGTDEFIIKSLIVYYDGRILTEK